jgi:hypothetical protein
MTIAVITAGNPEASASNSMRCSWTGLSFAKFTYNP